MGEPGEPVLDVTLQAGDTLYLPRGWLHEAKTSETDSLHLTMGVNVYTWMDAFRAALDSCAREVGFRRSPGGEDPGDLLDLLAGQLQPEDIERRRRRKLVRTRRPVLGGQLSQLRALESLDVDTVVERRATVLFDLEGATLSFEGKDLTFPDEAVVPTITSMVLDVRRAVHAGRPSRRAGRRGAPRLRPRFGARGLSRDQRSRARKRRGR